MNQEKEGLVVILNNLNEAYQNSPKRTHTFFSGIGLEIEVEQSQMRKWYLSGRQVFLTLLLNTVPEDNYERHTLEKLIIKREPKSFNKDNFKSNIHNIFLTICSLSDVLEEKTKFENNTKLLNANNLFLHHLYCLEAAINPSPEVFYLLAGTIWYNITLDYKKHTNKELLESLRTSFELYEISEKLQEEWVKHNRGDASLNFDCKTPRLAIIKEFQKIIKDPSVKKIKYRYVPNSLIKNFYDIGMKLLYEELEIDNSNPHIYEEIIDLQLHAIKSSTYSFEESEQIMKQTEQFIKFYLQLPDFSTDILKTAKLYKKTIEEERSLLRFIHKIENKEK